MWRALLAVAVAALVSQAHATAMGAVKLDNYTFDKVIAFPGYNWLVKVDKSYAYGEKEDAFKELCKLAHPVKDFLIGEIPVQEYGDKENDDLREKLAVKVDDFPTYFLFKGSFESRVQFTGFADPRAVKPATWDDGEDGAWDAPMKKDITVDNLALWLRMNGVKMPAIGTITEMDELAKSFMTGGMKDTDIESAKKLAAGDHKNDSKAPMYVRIMEKIKEKGAAYVQTELGRVKKLMSGKITPEKQAEMNDKVKILNVFAEV
jgi:endoplasmic reticulum protein 29